MDILFKNGKIKSIEVYKDGKLTGEYLEYFENGKIKVKGQYQCCSTLKSTSKDTLEDKQVITISTESACPSGTWIIYDENGKHIEKKYQNCKQVN